METDMGKSKNKSASSGGSQLSQKHETREFKLVDVQSIDHTNPLAAVKTFQYDRPTKIEHCDVLIVGGGFGGVAAALHALMPARPHVDGLSGAKLKNDLKVCLTEETDWLGGQATSQGVSALDENWLVESSGACREYQRLRSLIRRHYIKGYKLGSTLGNLEIFDPGSCWVSRLAFEPKVAIGQIEHMLKPAVDAQTLRMFMRHKTLFVNVDGGKDRPSRIKSVVMVALDSGETVEFRSRIVIDATELGDLLPMAALPYSCGAESKSETGEEHAPDVPEPNNVQDIVYPFVVELGDPADVHPVEEPDEYEEFKDRFSLLGYRVFENKIDRRDDGSERELLPFWTYRRLIAAKNFNDPRFARDLSMINWEANDFRGENIIDVDLETQARRLARAKSLSLGFLLWMQTEAERDDGGVGYPEFKLRPDVMGTTDGLSKFPYIRESRRIKAERTIVEQDIGAPFNPNARANLMNDTVGIGHYPIDIHGKQEPGAAQSTKPFQIPLGALVPRDCENLLPACKNIGTTHITNGAYRLHPIEWAIGTAAGALSRLSLSEGRPVRNFFKDENLMFDLQKHLIESGSPLYWFDDVPTWHEHFMEIQLLAIVGLMPGEKDNLEFQPSKAVSRRQAAKFVRAVFPKEKYSKVDLDDVSADDADYESIAFAVTHGLLTAEENGEKKKVRPDESITIAELAKLTDRNIVRLPRHRSVFIDAISPERLEGNPQESVTRSEFAMWLALMIDYKKAWHKLDLSVLNASTTPGTVHSNENPWR